MIVLTDGRSNPRRASEAVEQAAEDLAEIYRAIAVAIPCPASAFWGGR